MKNPFNALTFRFSLFGALIVAAQALPNILWALFPPAINRLEGNASSAAFIEYGEHVLGVAIVILLLFLENKRQPRKFPNDRWTITAYTAIMFYWLCWALYFTGVQPDFVIYAMVILPPVAFFSVGMAKKVWPVSIASAAFVIFHLLVAMENFPLGG